MGVQGTIDPQLQEPQTNPEPNLTAPSVDDHTPTDFRSPPAPLQNPQQRDQDHQFHYGALPLPPPPVSGPQWKQDGYNPYYTPSPNQYQPPMNPPQQHAAPIYHNFHVPGQAPTHSPRSLLTDPGEIRRARACEACRNLKVKCELDPAGGVCKRCSKSNRICMITEPSRKRQKKTDNRVAELERKIDALTQTLGSTQDGRIVDSRNNDNQRDSQAQMHQLGSVAPQVPAYPLNASADGDGQKRSFSEYQQDDPPLEALHSKPGAKANLAIAEKDSEMKHRSDDTQGSDLEVVTVKDGDLQGEIADELFYRYSKHMAPLMPIVIFPPTIRSDTIRTSNPVLFLAILSVACGKKYPDLEKKFRKKIMHTLIERMINGQSKSLEILQAMQVAILWYLPERGRESMYFQLIHMAAGLAVDLGINRKPGPKRKKFNILQHNSPDIDTESIECRRAWCGTYLLYSSVAMGMRRPNLIGDDGHLSNCLKILQKEGSGNNAILCQMVNLHMIADDLSRQILPDGFAPISETKARTAFKGFERKIKIWEGQTFSGKKSLTFDLTLNINNLHMHELLMQHVARHGPGKSAPRSRAKNDYFPSPNPTQDGSLSLGVIASLGILDSFLTSSGEEIRMLPTFFFAQIAHAIISLIKMYYVAKADPELNTHQPVTADMIERHLDQLVIILRSASTESLAADTSLQMMVIIQNLFGEHKDSDLATIKARYSGIPSLKETQMLDLEEPQPTPQHRTAPSEGTAGDALHVLSAVATGDTEANRSQSQGEQATRRETEESASLNGETAAVGQLIGEGDMGFMSDEGFIGIMQQMWARSK